MDYQYNTDSNDADVVDYIDKVASCSSNVTEEEQTFLECQKHRHKRTCRKGGKSVCQFEIPFPPMRGTMIIRPYEGENRSEYQSHFKLYSDNVKTKLKKSQLLMNFWKKVNLSEEDYIKAVQTSVKTSKVFLKRKTHGK